MEQGRDQDGDEGNMHRDQVLGEAGEERDGKAEQQFFRAHSLCDLAGCDVCQAGPSDGNCQDPEQDVAQSRFRVAAHTGDHGAESLAEIKSSGKTGYDRGDQDGQKYVHFQETQGCHDDYGNYDWIG